MSQVSFDQATENLSDRGITTPKRQAEELTVGVAVHFDDFYATTRGAMLPTTTAHLEYVLAQPPRPTRRDLLYSSHHVAASASRSCAANACGGGTAW